MFILQMQKLRLRICELTKHSRIINTVNLVLNSNFNDSKILCSCETPCCFSKEKIFRRHFNIFQNLLQLVEKYSRAQNKINNYINIMV